MKLPQLFLTGTGEKSVTVSSAVFGGEVNLDLLAQAVFIYQSNQRTAHAKAQRRGEVTATGKKVYKQKGTGRARHGARTAPLFVGGGQAHGPTGLQNYKKRLSQSMKTAALRSALAAQVQEKNAVIAQGAEKVQGQTKELGAALAPYTVKSDSRILVVIGDNDSFLRAAKNLAQVQVTRAARVNALEVVQADTVIVLNEALPILENRLGKKATKEEPLMAASPVKAEKGAEGASSRSQTEKRPRKARTATV